MKTNPANFPRLRQVQVAIERDHTSPSFIGPGWCLACGHKVTGVEPDASEYLCPKCDEHSVCSAEEILLMCNYK